MPKPFLIVKNANEEYNWSHFERDATTGNVLNDYSLSPLSMETTNGVFQVQSLNGAEKQEYVWTDIELRDDFSGVTGTPYFPTSANDLRNWLISKKYPAYAYLFATSGGIQSIVEGTNITVDNTDPLNPIVSSTGGGFSSLQQMYDDNPNKVQLTDGTNTMSLDPLNVFVSTDLGAGEGSVVGSQDVSGLGAYTQIENDGSNFLAKVIAEDSGNGTGAQLVSTGKILITRADGAVEIKSDNISANQDHQLPDGTGTYGLSVKVNGVSYPFNADGETDDIPVGGGGAVSSVNSQTGAVVLDADDISDSGTTNKWTNSTEKATWNGKQDALSGTGYSKWSGTTPGYVSQIPLSTDVTGVLPAANGGAGTVNGILKANGSGTVSQAVSGTDYNVSQVQNTVTTPSTTLASSTTAMKTYIDAKRYATYEFKASAFSPPDNSIYYFSNNNNAAPQTTSATQYVVATCPATTINWSCTIRITSIVSSGEDATIKIRNITTGVTVTLTTTMETNAAFNMAFGTAALVISAGDTLEVIFEAPTYATNPTNLFMYTLVSTNN